MRYDVKCIKAIHSYLMKRRQISYDMIYDLIWYDAILYDLICSDMIWSDMM